MTNRAVRVVGLTKVLSKFARKKRSLNFYIQNRVPEQAQNIAQLAKMMAPRDSGSLESSIKVEEKKFLFTYRAEVIVDGATRYTGRAAGTNVVGEYAKDIHDNQTPVGPIPLGKLSRAKQAANPQVQVGGNFMQRAFDQIAPEARTDMVRELRRIVRL